MTIRTRFCITAAALLLAGCAAQPAPRAGTATPGRIPPQDFAPGVTGEETTPTGIVLTNDPSAPADTPLCGHAAREANALGATVHPDITPLVSPCAANACFDAQTGTYIADDGSRRVCR
ncbi:hypothetical protein D3W54_07915 [Komagataeibacter medellinensis]|uniref:Lectin-like protein BA14k n=2 Tax=Komagataeibacter medellinensis TaxID=1177712 RepID=G2I0H6_KOMMN|nr:BA14K family protein [Komagataeibacter medellinensis]KAB8124143.1 hypothetical protein D3W54_07915 [Komagataeibacter medellinensis]BAK84434.1 hypothetical protein GLX_20220 [Komagataeibacter medellinensis NBRC 3288]